MLQKALKRLLLGIWTLNVLLVKAQMEMNNVGNWREGDTCFKLVKNVDELYVSVVWKTEPVTDGLGYLAEILSKALKVLSFSLWLTLKCERKGIN